MSMCGGRNIFGDATNTTPKISVEAVLKRNPDVSSAGSTAAQKTEWLGEWRQWKTLNAVKDHYLFAIHPDIMQRYTVRVLEGAQQLCETLEGIRKQWQQQLV